MNRFQYSWIKFKRAFQRKMAVRRVMQLAADRMSEVKLSQSDMMLIGYLASVRVFGFEKGGSLEAMERTPHYFGDWPLFEVGCMIISRVDGQLYDSPDRVKIVLKMVIRLAGWMNLATGIPDDHFVRVINDRMSVLGYHISQGSDLREVHQHVISLILNTIDEGYPIPQEGAPNFRHGPMARLHLQEALAHFELLTRNFHQAFIGHWLAVGEND